MSLIPCAECGAEISDKAVACPRCGCPRSEMGPGPEPTPAAAAAPAAEATAEPAGDPPARFATGVRALKRGVVLNLIAVPLLEGATLAMLMLNNRIASRPTDKLVFGLGMGLGLFWLLCSLCVWLAARSRKPWAKGLILARLIATPVSLAWLVAATGLSGLTTLMVPAFGVPMLAPTILTWVAEIIFLVGCAITWSNRSALLPRPD